MIGGRDGNQADVDIHRFDVNAVPEPIGNDVDFDADDGFGKFSCRVSEITPV